MAISVIPITTTWQRVGTGIATFTVHTAGKGPIYFNTSASDVFASQFSVKQGDQFFEDEVRETWVRGDNEDGMALKSDGEIA